MVLDVGTTVMRLRAVTLLRGLAWLSLIKSSNSRQRQDCDNGKAKLEMDLPRSDELMCPELWSHSTRKLTDISTKYSLQPAEHICMNKPITYNPTIPNSGAHRPVGAISGEYLYCPPQRWLKNLKDGATVLLYHPCASEDARISLAGLAHSCLPDYILTPHHQLSQHRPYALVSWGHTLEMSHVTSSGVCQWLLTASSNLNQTEEIRGPKYSLYLTKAAPVDRVQFTTVKSLRACCVEALSAHEKTAARTRTSRAALHPKKAEVENKDEVKVLENLTHNSFESKKTDSTHTLNITEDKGSPSADPPGRHVTSLLHSALETAGDKSTTRGPSKDHSEVQEKVVETSEKDVKPHKMDVRKHRITTDTEVQRVNCDGQSRCEASDTTSPNIGGPLRGQRMPTARTDEAVWAAAALGFLLVLLTVSILHTRLYRHWRTPPSLYWHETQQDYESVADIIRRRLRMVGRRKRRISQSRRQECPLLPDSSTDNESD